ncbi:protein kinase domain-containing protein [Pirellulaceae bacterium SH449]
MTSNRCLTDEELVALLLGEINTSTLPSLFQHVDHCSLCQERATTLAESSSPYDSLLQSLSSLTREHGNSVTPAPLTLPSIFGQYELLEELGSGGMGTVYHAKHRNLGKHFALKILGDVKPSSHGVWQTASHEWLAHGKLDHPNIVQATDAGYVDGVAFLVMERIDGINLQQLVEKIGPIPGDAAAEIVCQACRGLHYAHQLGLVHHDIKPANIMVDSKGTVKILDLGIADFQNISTEQPSATDTSSPLWVRGSKGYMAPERYTLCKPSFESPKCDQFSLGATLCFLLTSHPDIHSASAKEMVIAPDLRKIVQRMLSENPEDRYQDLDAAIADLEPWANRDALWRLLGTRDENIGGASISEGLLRMGKSPSSTTPAKRQLSVVWGSVALLLCVLLGAWFFILSTYSPPSKYSPPIVNMENEGRFPLSESTTPTPIPSLENAPFSALASQSLENWTSNPPLGAVLGLSWSPDGTYLAVYSGDGALRVFQSNDQDLTLAWSFYCPLEHSCYVRWDSTGKQIAVAGNIGSDIRLEIWDVLSQTRLIQRFWPSEQLYGVDWLTETYGIICATSQGLRFNIDDSLAHEHLFPSYRPRCLCRLPTLHNANLDSNPRSRFAFIDIEQGKIIAAEWDKNDAHSIHEEKTWMVPPVGDPVDIAYSHAFNNLIATFHRSVEVHSFDDEPSNRILPRGNDILSVSSLESDNPSIAVGFEGGWRLATLSGTMLWNVSEEFQVPDSSFAKYQVAARPGSSELAIGTHSAIHRLSDTQTAKIVSFTGGSIIDALADADGYWLCNQQGLVAKSNLVGELVLQTFVELPAPPEGFAQVIDDRYLAIQFTESSTPVWWDVNERVLVPSHNGSDDNGFLYSLSSRYSKTSFLVQWDRSDHSWKRRMNSVRNPRFLSHHEPSGLIAIGNYRQEIEILLTESMATVRRWPPFSAGSLKAIEWNPKGDGLIVSCDRGDHLEIMSLNPSDGAIQWRRRWPLQKRTRVNHLALFDNRSLLISINESFIQFDAATGEVLRSLELMDPQLHDMRMFSHADSPTFATLTHLDSGGFLIVWDKTTWYPLQILRGNGARELLTFPLKVNSESHN